MNRDVADNEIRIQAKKPAENAKEPESGSGVSAHQNTREIDEKSHTVKTTEQTTNKVDLPYTSESTHFSTH
ncbi:hypothetical protein DdX_13011 [Ditylenchus destructor]|uniref:Uncharacterized protein n=1 Tax=Ditylenchus destructor TaxID=166010 RepID=A0AAD4MXE5_9BILA|nr:hypothetical protein DdX_13011 [Ditylenchus destructor]